MTTEMQVLMQISKSEVIQLEIERNFVNEAEIIRGELQAHVMDIMNGKTKHRRTTDCAKPVQLS